MKNFFKDNKYFAVYLMGSLISVFSLFRAGHLVFGLIIQIIVILLFAYLYFLSSRKK